MLLLFGLMYTAKHRAPLEAPRAEVPKNLEDILLSLAQPQPGRSIFFLETDCHWQRNKTRHMGQHPHSSYNLLSLTKRQACSIESAAMHHPSYQVFVLFACSTYRQQHKTQEAFIEALLGYENVELRQLHINRYAMGTPIEDWLKYGELYTSNHVTSHISDFLRYVTLYRYGGIYMDMDVLVLRSLEQLPPNYTGAESATDLGAGVMSFSPVGIGHQLAKRCLLDLEQNFNGQGWGTNGPGVITRVSQNVCDTFELTEMLNNRERCRGFQIYEPSVFYPVASPLWLDYFEPAKLSLTLERTAAAYTAHMWNTFSKNKLMAIGSGSAYDKLAQQHCPKVYAAAGEYL
ncbi:lactosylceramide 4-alpha-galactosyltransferase-like [Drosophila busckii]|uniref:lactosylceramide 4-alpha-galactosyltransferase-like n=1 Tax=Drosophila busckii TaxID=30019 RepID=UPI00083EE883|nr:lactosylceramide 4-alpha-galactosyltransferase-like [Drosophila busckii]